jgi:hypothetical protein
LKLPWRIADHAEVISSVGVALALVREEIERGAGTDPVVLAHEATERAIAAGADADTIQVVTENLPERGVVRAIATGALALESRGTTLAHITETEARALAAKRGNTTPGKVDLVGETPGFRVYHVQGSGGLLKRGWRGIIVIDQHGGIRLMAENGTASNGTPPELLKKLSGAINGNSVLDAIPTVTLLRGSSLIHVSSKNGNLSALAAVEAAFQDIPSSESIIVVVERRSWL